MYLRTERSLLVPVLAVVILLIATGCNEDCVCPEDDSGVIAINPSPDHLDATWTLDGPEDYNDNGSGDQIISSLLPGEYTLTWGDVSGWITPTAESQTLPANGTLTFSGIYVEPGTGAIVINPSPDHLDAPWVLDGPESYNESGTGDQTLNGLSPGDYTVTWGDVSGWLTPSAEGQTLSTDVTVTFSGAFVIEEEHTGTITIDQTPDVLNGAGWTLSGPNNEIGQGDATLTDMVVGIYTLSWDYVDDYITPVHLPKTLIADGAITFIGTYEYVPPEFTAEDAAELSSFIAMALVEVLEELASKATPQLRLVSRDCVYGSYWLNSDPARVYTDATNMLILDFDCDGVPDDEDNGVLTFDIVSVAAVANGSGVLLVDDDSGSIFINAVLIEQDNYPSGGQLIISIRGFIPLVEFFTDHTARVTVDGRTWDIDLANAGITLID